MRQSLKIFLAVIVTFLITSVLFLIGGFYAVENFPLGKVLKVYRMIENHYVGEYDKEEAELAAVNAFLAGEGAVSRVDILQAMNRMSSMLYILMIEQKAKG